MNPRLESLRDAGVSIWLDTLSRDLLESGDFARLIRDCSVTGATSNPTIFAAAITGSDRYDDQLLAAASSGIDDARELFFALALADVARAADLLLPTHVTSGGRDGFVSFECTPDIADDARRTIEQALELWIPARATERDDQGRSHRSRGLSHRGAHRARRQRERDAAYSVARYSRSSTPTSAASSADSAPANASTQSTRSPPSSCRESTPKPMCCCPRAPSCEAAWRSRTRNGHTPAIANASPTHVGAGCARQAPIDSVRSGPALRPRTRPTPTSATSKASSRRT